MKKQLLFCFIGITLLLGFESKVNAVPIANTAKSLSAAPTTYTWTGAADVKWSNKANWLPSTGYPGMNVGVYDDVFIGTTVNMPTVDIAITYCETIDITGNTTLTLGASLTAHTSFTVENNVVLTLAVINYDPYNPFYLSPAKLTVGISGGLIASPGSNIQANGGDILLLTNAYI